MDWVDLFKGNVSSQETPQWRNNQRFFCASVFAADSPFSLLSWRSPNLLLAFFFSLSVWRRSRRGRVGRMAHACVTFSSFLFSVSKKKFGGWRVFERRSEASGSDAFYDRGSTFPLECFLQDGIPEPKIVGRPILFRKKKRFCILGGHVGMFIGTPFDFC